MEASSNEMKCKTKQISSTWNSKQPFFMVVSKLFQLDDSKSLHKRCLEITITMH